MTQNLASGFESQPKFPPRGFVAVKSLVTGIEVYAPALTDERQPDVMDFQCPKCGASVAFSVDLITLHCEHCGYRETIAQKQLGRAAEGFEFRVETIARSERGWGEGRKDLACQRCGGVISVPHETLAYTCPFCGSNRVLFREPLEDILRPRFLIPFQVPPTSCREIIRKWLGSSWMLPQELRSTTIDRFNPIYIPYWTFHAACHAIWKAEVAHETTEVYYEHGERRERTRVEWRSESGKLQKDFENLLVPGTTRLNLKSLGRIDHFNVDGLALYEPRYLAGMQAQSYDIPLEQAWDAGRHIMREQVRKACLDRASSGRVRNFTATLDFDKEEWRYILVPVYTSLYRYANEPYQVLINGQTGQVAGPRPVDWQKVWLVIALMLLPGFLMVFLGMLTSIGEVIGGGLFLLFVCLVIDFFIFTQARELEHD